MKLRDHPLMSHNGSPNWPPTWVGIDNSSTRPLAVAENGTLTQVTFHALGESKIALRMNNESGEYIAHIYFNNHASCLWLYECLKDYIGKPNQDAGDLDFATL